MIWYAKLIWVAHNSLLKEVFCERETTATFQDISSKLRSTARERLFEVLEDLKPSWAGIG
jgi:hypothetical protein